MKAINSHVGAWSPMAEQHATANYLKQDAAIDKYFTHFKSEISERLNRIYDGFIQLKNEGYDCGCGFSTSGYLSYYTN